MFNWDLFFITLFSVCRPRRSLEWSGPNVRLVPWTDWFWGFRMDYWHSTSWLSVSFDWRQVVHIVLIVKLLLTKRGWFTITMAFFSLQTSLLYWIYFVSILESSRRVLWKTRKSYYFGDKRLPSCLQKRFLVISIACDVYLQTVIIEAFVTPPTYCLFSSKCDLKCYLIWYDDRESW